MVDDSGDEIAGSEASRSNTMHYSSMADTSYGSYSTTLDGVRAEVSGNSCSDVAEGIIVDE